jgi:hypothetical protein
MASKTSRNPAETREIWSMNANAHGRLSVGFVTAEHRQQHHGDRQGQAEREQVPPRGRLANVDHRERWPPGKRHARGLSAIVGGSRVNDGRRARFRITLGPRVVGLKSVTTGRNVAVDVSGPAPQVEIHLAPGTAECLECNDQANR